MKEVCECCNKEKDVKNMIHYYNYPVPEGTINLKVCKNCDTITDNWLMMVSAKRTKLREVKENE